MPPLFNWSLASGSARSARLRLFRAAPLPSSRSSCSLPALIPPRLPPPLLAELRGTSPHLAHPTHPTHLAHPAHLPHPSHQPPPFPCSARHHVHRSEPSSSIRGTVVMTTASKGPRVRSKKMWHCRSPGASRRRSKGDSACA